MKKAVLFLLPAMAALTVHAGVPVPVKATVSVAAHAQSHKARRHAPIKAVHNVAPANTPLAEHEWEEMGAGQYTDDLLTSSAFFDDIVPVTFEVRVQADKANPGVYRIIDPWRNYPAESRKIIEEDWEGELALGDDYYIVLDARDPDFVRLLRSPIGMSDAGGPTEAIGYSEAYDIDPAKDEAFDGQYDLHGTMTDNVITFTDECAIGLIQDDDSEECGYYIYNTNQNGAFALYLPGASAPVKYEINMYTETVCPDDNNHIKVHIEGDNRIHELRYVIADELTDETIASAAEGSVAHVGDEIDIDFNKATGKKLYLIVAMYDEAGEEHAVTYGEFDVPGAYDSEWKPIGKARMTEGLLSCLSMSHFTSETFDVEVEENIYLHDYYRLVNPYDTWSQSAPYSAGHAHKHYLYINAYDPDEVFVEYSPVGLDVSVFGEIVVSSDYFVLCQQYGRDILKEYNIHSGGTMRDKVIEFNNRNDIRVLCYNLGQWFYTNRLVNPAYNEDDRAAAEAAGEEYDVDPYIAGPFKLDLSGTDASDNIIIEAADTVPAMYYDLQGRPAPEQPAPGMYICRQGDKATKVIIR